MFGMKNLLRGSFGWLFVFLLVGGMNDVILVLGTLYTTRYVWSGKLMLLGTSASVGGCVAAMDRV